MSKIRILSVFLICVFNSTTALVLTEPPQFNNETESLLAQMVNSSPNEEETNGLLNKTRNPTSDNEALITSSRMASLPSNAGNIVQILSNPESLFQIFSGESLTLATVSSACREDMRIFIQGLTNGTEWALRMIDAMGKPNANLESGQTKFLGSYEECTSTHATYQTASGEVDSFDGKYCTTYFTLSRVPTQVLVTGFGYVQLGLCLPNTCSTTDFEKMVNIVRYLLLNGSDPLPSLNTCQEGPKDFDTAFYVATSVLTLLGTLILMGTIYDVIIRLKDERRNNYQLAVTNNGKSVKLEKDSEKMCTVVIAKDQTKPEIDVHLEREGVFRIGDSSTEIKQFTTKKGKLSEALLAFSCYTNGAKILSTEQSGSLGAVNGIRFLSMAWVILGHTYFFGQRYDANLLQYTMGNLNDWTFMAIAYASPSVDSFFTLSGVLVAYISLKQLDKVGGVKGMNWFMYYFHRFWRLTPAYMLVLMVGAVILPYTLFGPLWNSKEMPAMDSCDENWWTNLLYVNNYVRTNQTCMGWSWYLADDMQYYWISPILILPLFYHLGAGIMSCLVLLIGSAVSVGMISYDHRYPVQRLLIGQLPPELMQTGGGYNKNVYVPSYARIGPYIVGVFTGYLLYRWKCTCKMPKVIKLLGWFLCIGLTSTVIYWPYSDDGDNFFTVLQSAVYYALHRTVWGVAISWIVFTCATGNGGWINLVLSWKAFIPLGRLTYCAYLIHPLVMYMFYSSRMETTFFTDYEMIYLFLFFVSLSYGLAFIVSLVFESPMMALEKVLFNTGRK